VGYVCVVTLAFCRGDDLQSGHIELGAEGDSHVDVRFATAVLRVGD
jgi:hypothetical protein